MKKGNKEQQQKTPYNHGYELKKLQIGALNAVEKLP